MISKKTFVDTINSMVNLAVMEEDIRNIYRKNNIEMCGGDVSWEYEGIISRLLTEVMEDENEWISWWLYERDYGRDVTPKSASYSEREYIDLTTPEKLYDFLYNEYLDKNSCDSEENVN